MASPTTGSLQDRGTDRAGLRLAVVGVGAIGQEILVRVARGEAGNVTIVAVADLPAVSDRLEDLAERYGCAMSTDPRAVADARPDIVLEAASQDVVRTSAAAWLADGSDVLLMSVGALADPVLLEELTRTARRTGRRVLLPSGAIGGLDVIRTARLDRLDDVHLTTTKAPRGLVGAPYLIEHGIDVEQLKARTIVFDGLAREAVTAFPANLNVVAALSLAGLGPDLTRVTLVADPATTRNTHEVVARGSFGELRLTLENVPSPDNPKTSYLACLSPIALLRRLSDPVQLGS
jgi:aspartate dehydrogenase